MKSVRPITILVMSLLALASTSTAFAMDRANYVAMKPGIFTPGGDADDFDPGTYVELAFGHYFNQNFAIEFSMAGAFAERKGPDAWLDVAPITSVNAKGVIPLGHVELYGMAGFGVYDVYIEGISRYDISDTVTGANFGLGVTYKPVAGFGIGVEYKSFSAEDVGDWEFGLEGTTLSAVVRVGF